MRLPSFHIGYRAWLAALVSAAILATALLALALAVAMAFTLVPGTAWAGDSISAVSTPPSAPR
jgi:hypothetical protein